MPPQGMSAEELAKIFHETYEAQSEEFGYKTRKATAKPWDEIPADNPNKKLMVSVCAHILAVFAIEKAAARADERVKAWNEALAKVEESRCELCVEGHMLRKHHGTWQHLVDDGEGCNWTDCNTHNLDIFKLPEAAPVEPSEGEGT